MLFRATQLALPCWLKSTVVFLPTLKLFQLSNACAAVWLIVTVVLPDALAWVGVFAPTQVFHWIGNTR